MPSQEFKNQKLKLVFDVIEEGGKVYVKGTELLVESVISYLYRTVNSMKKSSSQITVDRVIKSIKDSIVADARRKQFGLN